MEKNLEDLIDNQDNKIVNIEVLRDQKGNPELNVEYGIYKLPFYVNQIYDSKEYTAFIKCIEKEVRRSSLYSEYIGILRNDVGLHSCAIMGNITDEQASIEFHHYPFTLYDIVSIVVEHKLLHKHDVSSFLVAQEVIDLHFKNMIGLVPLSTTVHELVHVGKIFINASQVFGDIVSFIHHYEDGISENLITDFNKVMELSETMETSDSSMLDAGNLSWNLQKNKNTEDIT